MDGRFIYNKFEEFLNNDDKFVDKFVEVEKKFNRYSVL